MNPPEDLAAYLDANLPDGVQLYGYAADLIAPPAVVITPGDPFQAPYTQGGPGSVAWGLELKLVAKRASPKYALRALYELRAQVTALFPAYTPMVRWLAFDTVSTVQIGDVDYLQGTLTTVLVTADE